MVHVTGRVKNPKKLLANCGRANPYQGTCDWAFGCGVTEWDERRNTYGGVSGQCPWLKGNACPDGWSNGGGPGEVLGACNWKGENPKKLPPGCGRAAPGRGTCDWARSCGVSKWTNHNCNLKDE